MRARSFEEHWWSARSPLPQPPSHRGQGASTRAATLDLGLMAGSG